VLDLLAIAAWTGKVVQRRMYGSHWSGGLASKSSRSLTKSRPSRALPRPVGTSTHQLRLGVSRVWQRRLIHNTTLQVSQASSSPVSTGFDSSTRPAQTPGRPPRPDPYTVSSPFTQAHKRLIHLGPSRSRYRITVKGMPRLSDTPTQEREGCVNNATYSLLE
jgi:hypothetical protein